VSKEINQIMMRKVIFNVWRILGPNFIRRILTTVYWLWMDLQRCVRRCSPSCREVNWAQLRRQVHQHSVSTRQEHGQERDQHYEPATSPETAQSPRRVRRPTRDGHGARIVSETSSQILLFCCCRVLLF